MLVTVREFTPEMTATPFEDWHDDLGMTRARRDYLDARREMIGARDVTLHYYAGTLAPWSKEMHVVSDDPAVPTGRLEFEADEGRIRLPQGELVLTRDVGDVIVRRP